MQLTVHGNHNLTTRPLDKSSDLVALKRFCNQCRDLGWRNNESFLAMKLDEMELPWGQYWVAVTPDNHIVSVAGVHKLPEIGVNAYRCLFRGAQLPGYSPEFSTNLFNMGIHYAYFLYQQIVFIQNVNPLAEFYITTNVSSDTGASSSRMNNLIMPRQARLGVWSLAHANFMLYNIVQNVWQVDVAEYFRQRDLWQQQRNAGDTNLSVPVNSPAQR